ncbi:hypothetical protein QZH41_018008 [Actinostola sp. cb2023]|nr:hypothetical protein QZH41_018008 [Actinostola sp. cb2023]
MSLDQDDIEEFMDADSSDYGDEDDEYEDDYYTRNDGEDEGIDPSQERDPEFFSYSLLNVDETRELLNSSICKTSKEMQIPQHLARLLLVAYSWDLNKLLERHRVDPVGLMVDLRLIPKKQPRSMVTRAFVCPICFQRCPKSSVTSLACGHGFCDTCWNAYLANQIQNGVSTSKLKSFVFDMECMNCDLIVGEEIVIKILTNPSVKEKYKGFLFNDEVKSHPGLRWCPGRNCGYIVKADEPSPKRVICNVCNSMFCFSCGENYHVPTECVIIKKWLTKCEDDSETANYITANTKDCPKCNSCIEKNGGCNHMQCIKCKHDFCWMCMGNWKTHGSEYYECSRYKSNPNIANESAGIQAREALKKYLFYFERWQNHTDSLKKEAETRRKINQNIEEKVNNNMGTWIDWQYLLNATALLARCVVIAVAATVVASVDVDVVVALLNVVAVVAAAVVVDADVILLPLLHDVHIPVCYFMEDDRKKLFEYQQAQLEVEIENLSWKLERDESYSRGDFENQMDIAEKRRRTLLNDFSPGNSSTSKKT